MNPRLLAYLLLLATVILFCFIQHLPLLTIGGVKPNIVLALLLASALFLTFPPYLVLVLASYFLLKLEPSFDWPIFVFSALMLVGFGVIRTLPWQHWLSVALTTIAATIGLYASIAPHLLATAPALISAEAIYNALLGLLFYALLARMKA